MAHYYGYCQVHGKIGDDYDESIPNAKKKAWIDCDSHRRTVKGPHGTVAPKIASSMVLPNGTKRYSYKLLKRDKESEKGSKKVNVFRAKKKSDVFEPKKTELHFYRKTNVCQTDSRGYATPKNMSPFEIVLDASEGFIPLWAENVNLRWRFNPNALLYFQDPESAKNAIRELFGEAVLKWGDAAPINFSEREDAWDFEISVRHSDNCSNFGCTLASAFFPDGGRHELVIYPKMFTQSHKERVDTLLHEIGHIFGLRHFFANIKESRWPSEIYGKHKPFSIMNYGDKSQLTKYDKSDLKSLYQKVWAGELKNINGTRIVQVRPYHELT